MEYSCSLVHVHQSNYSSCFKMDSLRFSNCSEVIAPCSSIASPNESMWGIIPAFVSFILKGLGPILVLYHVVLVPMLLFKLVGYCKDFGLSCSADTLGFLDLAALFSWTSLTSSSSSFSSITPVEIDLFLESSPSNHRL